MVILRLSLSLLSQQFGCKKSTEIQRTEILGLADMLKLKEGNDRVKRERGNGHPTDIPNEQALSTTVFTR